MCIDRGLKLGDLGEELKKGLGGGNWTKKFGIQMDTTTGEEFFKKPWQVTKGIGENIQANVNWAKDRIGPNAWDKGQWMDRTGLGRTLGLKGSIKDWEGGKWLDRIGAGPWQKDLMGKWGEELSKGWKDMEGWQGGGWVRGLEPYHWQDRFGVRDEIEEYNKAWGGGAWYKDRLGMGQFDKKGGGGADTGDEPNSTTPNTGDPEEEPIEEQMVQLTNEDPQEAARLAATRARRRRALKNKFGKRQTIRTSGRGATGY